MQQSPPFRPLDGGPQPCRTQMHVRRARSRAQNPIPLATRARSAHTVPLVVVQLCRPTTSVIPLIIPTYDTFAKCHPQRIPMRCAGARSMRNGSNNRPKTAESKSEQPRMMQLHPQRNQRASGLGSATRRSCSASLGARDRGMKRSHVGSAARPSNPRSDGEPSFVARQKAE